MTTTYVNASPSPQSNQPLSSKIWPIWALHKPIHRRKEKRLQPNLAFIVTGRFIIAYAMETKNGPWSLSTRGERRFTTSLQRLRTFNGRRYVLPIEPCADRAAAADNLWAPPPIPLLLRSYFWEFSMTSSLISLPSGRSRPIVSCFSMLSFFFKFAVFLGHHPVQ